MTDKKNWNWEIGKRSVAPVGQWQQTYEWVEEPCVSPDGETVAAVVNTGDLAFSVCANGNLWENTYDKVWGLQFTSQASLVGLVSDMGQWSLAVDGISWESSFEYLWNIQMPDPGKSIVCAGKNGMEYFAVIDGTSWSQSYSNLTELTVAPGNGAVKTAASVQVVDFSEGDIDTFQKGCYSVAVDGKAWERRFVNVWDITLSPDGKSAAAVVRRTLYDYTIVVDGHDWKNGFASVWKPEFNPSNGNVTAPVKLPEGWTLAQAGQPIWKNRYVQLWHHQYSKDGRRIAAIVAPSFGRWTVAVDDQAWPVTFKDWAADIVISPQGERIACIGAQDGRQSICIDGTVWPQKFDQAWPVVFSPRGDHAAAKVKKDNRYYLALDAKLHSEAFDWMAVPVFCPEGDKVMIRAIQGTGESATYQRIVIPVTDIRG